MSAPLCNCEVQPCPVHVGRTVLEAGHPGYVVSTVRLGPDVRAVDVVLDPLLGRTPKPFESMVFASENDFTDLDCRRYDTHEAALAGHLELVALWSGEPS